MSREFEIVNRLGMHARPAQQFVEIARRYPCRVTVYRDEKQIDGKSIMEMMLLEATKGTVLRVEAEGEEAEVCLEALAELVRAGFYED